MRKSLFPAAVMAGMIAAAALLIFAFTVPGRYLKEMTGKMSVQAELGKSAILEGDAEEAAKAINAMGREFLRSEKKLRLFFHQEELDELKRTLKTCRDLVALDQSDNLICELNSVIKTLEHMNSVATTDIYEVF